MSVHMTCSAQRDASRAGVVSADGSGASGPPAEAPIVLANAPSAGHAWAPGLAHTRSWASPGTGSTLSHAVRRMSLGWGALAKAGMSGTCVTRRVLRNYVELRACDERAADQTQRRRALSARPRAGPGALPPQQAASPAGGAPAGAPAAAAAGAPEGVGLAYNAPPWWDAPPGWGAAGACGAPPRPLAALASASVTNDAAPTVTLRFPAPYAADACAPGCLLAAVGPGALVPGTWAAAAGDAYTFTLQARRARGCGPVPGRGAGARTCEPPSSACELSGYMHVSGTRAPGRGSLTRRWGPADLRRGPRLRSPAHFVGLR